MIKKSLFILLAIILVNCGGNKAVVRTRRSVDPKKVLVYKKPEKKSVTIKKTPKTVQKTYPIIPKDKKVVTNLPTKTSTSTPQKTITPVKQDTARKILDIETKPIVESDDNLLLEIIEKARAKKESEANKPHYDKAEVLEATSKVRVTTQMVYDYIDRYKTIAKSNMNQYGIPSSIILAQGILESGTGKGSLSLLANNHFGIKCKTEWTGPSVFFDDDAEQECFRKYDSGDESYTDHALFLSNRSYYVPLFQLQKDDYKAWAHGLKKAGYATDVNYPTKLISIIERYNLNRYDDEVLGRISPEEPSIKETILVSATDGNYQVNPGDTLYSISKKFNIPIEKLIEKNDIKNFSLSIGQNLIVN